MSFWNNKIKAAGLFTGIVCALYGTRALFPKRGAGIDPPTFSPTKIRWPKGSRAASEPPRRTTVGGGGGY